jgi:disulfide bond formation protein DsbB
MITNTTPSSRPALTAPFYVAWSTALAASAASVYFIEILGHPAATLCWLNRMLVFGIFLVLSVGAFTRERGVWRYVVPFLVIGLPVAFYQQLVHWDIIHVVPKVCSVSVVCTTKFFNLFGFISQATLCLAAFTTIAVCVWRLAKTRD